MTPRRICRIDANQREISEAHVALGHWWIDTHQVGQLIPGFPDGIAGIQGRLVFVEIKNGKRRLTHDEQVFQLLCQAVGVPYVIERTVDDVLAAHNKYAGGEDGR